MSNWEIDIIVVAICAGCKLIGELWWHDAQRFIMPIALGIAFSIVSHTWWLGLTVLPSIGPLCLGYKTFGKNDAFARGMWLFLISVAIGLGALLTHHLGWYFYLPYIIIAGIWGSTTRNLWNVIIAPISGALLGSIIFFVR